MSLRYRYHPIPDLNTAALMFIEIRDPNLPGQRRSSILHVLQGVLTPSSTSSLFYISEVNPGYFTEAKGRVARN